MYFGATPYASAAFSDVGFNPNAFVNVLGSQVNQSNNTVATIGKALVLPTGIQNNFSIGNLVIRINQTASPTDGSILVYQQELFLLCRSRCKLWCNG